MPVVNSITSGFIDLRSTGERWGWIETGVGCLNPSLFTDRYIYKHIL